jgi:hypothetical protein
MRSALANLLMPNNAAFEVEEELQFHLEMLEGKYTQQGMSVAEAKAAALRRFGNVARIKQRCVDIRRRNSLLRQVLKTSSILIALAGLTIHILSSNVKISHMGDVLIMIAISGRLLLYVRGLSPATFLPQIKQTSLSVVSDKPECS